MALRHPRRSGNVHYGPRWAALRLEALRRDDWKCVQCDARGRLEVDHILPVRSHPDLAYELRNLQSLCPSCHARKTRIEVGMGTPNPAREAWKDAVRAMMPAAKRNKHKRTHHA